MTFKFIIIVTIMSTYLVSGEKVTGNETVPDSHNEKESENLVLVNVTETSKVGTTMQNPNSTDRLKVQEVSPSTVTRIIGKINSWKKIFKSAINVNLRRKSMKPKIHKSISELENKDNGNETNVNEVERCNRKLNLTRIEMIDLNDQLAQCDAKVEEYENMEFLVKLEQRNELVQLRTNMTILEAEIVRLNYQLAQLSPTISGNISESTSFTTGL